jgi:hypothetical protein
MDYASSDIDDAARYEVELLVGDKSEIDVQSD